MSMKEERARRGWSQTHVTTLTGISQSDLSAIENGRRLPGAGWRRRLADVFGVSEVELFGPERKTRRSTEGAR
jgi:transcriptional regulator with XRE-family HTH domain